VKDKQESLRGLPSVEALVAGLEASEEGRGKPRQVIVECAREVLAELRRSILDGTSARPYGVNEVIELVAERLGQSDYKGIRRVLNATGVIVHTNLGRSLLSPEACRSVNEVSSSYCSLEIDLVSGKRTSRSIHVGRLLSRLTGSEDALVVNNNAAAVMLSLNTLCRDKEVVVSRGELVEIGGSFRLPEIMQRSGAVLVEVGTTNRTRLDDYEGALNERTGAILKVHQSNFMMWGYVESAPTAELARLAHGRGLILIDDLGSGALYDFSAMGLDREPMPADSLKSGSDLVTFSGDKLMGGPQAGIIAGRSNLVRECKSNPMARALRVDKTTLAALQATLELYLEPERLPGRLPVLRMISMPASDIGRRAEGVAAALGAVSKSFAVSVREDESRIGGGALPGSALPTFAVVIEPERISPDGLLRELRKCRIPIIARISEDRVLLDLRTVDPQEDGLIIDLVTEVLARLDDEERS
jgi:L-seryl-tRNA(Ser) seleniumtransferase